MHVVPVKICPTKYAAGYAESSWDDFRITGGRYCKTQWKDQYTRMAHVRAHKLNPET